MTVLLPKQVHRPQCQFVDPKRGTELAKIWKKYLERSESVGNNLSILWERFMGTFVGAFRGELKGSELRLRLKPVRMRITNI